MAREADSLRSFWLRSRAEAAPSCQSVVGGGKKQDTYRKKHRYRRGPKGPGILSRGPGAVGGNQGKQGSDRQVRPHSPTSQTIQTRTLAPAQHHDANSHQLEDRRLPPNLPPNEETSPLGEVQPFMKRIHFRFRGTCRILLVL